MRCGAWTLVKEIGRGASGTVYLATKAGGETAAVKVCLRETLPPDRYARELRGAKLYQALGNAGEGLVRMLELGECDAGFYMAMELADDEFGARASEVAGYRPKTLSHVISGEKALPLADSLKVGVALARGLVTLQRHHLLHRDIKPGNVVYVRGNPVLSDPGLLVEESEAASLVGTPGYVPPENFIAAGGDVYSLGLTLKAASFGRPVEELERGPSIEADTGHALFPAWWRMLNKATHPDASRRYRSAKALLKDIRLLRLRLRLFRFMRRTPLVILGVTFLLAVVLCIVLFKVKRDWNAYEKRQDSEENSARAYLKVQKTQAKADAGRTLSGIRAALEGVQESSDKACQDMRKAGGK